MSQQLDAITNEKMELTGLLMQKNNSNDGNQIFNKASTYSSFNREEMQKQIENLNRHVFNTTKN